MLISDRMIVRRRDSRVLNFEVKDRERSAAGRAGMALEVGIPDRSAVSRGHAVFGKGLGILG